MKIIFNSVETELPDGASVGEMKELMKLASGGVAVAVNGKIVPASAHAGFRLSEGDDVVAIGAAYGG